jgi:hypothetical protein
VFFASLSFSQKNVDEYLFIKSFIDREELAEAQVLIAYNLTQNYSSDFLDTLRFLNALIDFKKQNIELTVDKLNQIENKKVFNTAPIFYKKTSHLFLSEFNADNEKVEAGTAFYELYLLNQLGEKLLKREFDNLEQYSDFSDYRLMKEYSQLKGIQSEYQDRKWKSPFVAGALSAVLPGSGKWYAGKKGEAFSSFFQVGLTGYMAYENYRNGGFRNPQFYLFGALFSAYYLGNIFGSTLSIHTENRLFDEQYERAIIINLRLALRNFFE